MGIRDRILGRVRGGRRPSDEGVGKPAETPSRSKPRPTSRVTTRRSQLLREELEPTSSPATESAPAAPEPVIEVPSVSATPAAMPAPSQPEAAPTTDSTTEFTVEVRNPESGEVLSFSVGPDEAVCDAADRAGLEIPSSCRSGGCLVCCGKLLRGEVEMGEQFVLEDADISEGFRLLCCTTLSSDAQFVSHQSDEVGTG